MGAEGARPRRGLILDSGALIAYERADRRVRGVLRLALERGDEVHVPAGVVGQVWRDGSRQARLARFLRAPQVIVDPLDERDARAVGILCGRAGTTDVVDASVVVVARRHRAPVITSDPDDLARLDPGIDLHRC